MRAGEKEPETDGRTGRAGGPIRLLIALSLIQDLDLLLPVARAADADERFAAEIWVADVLTIHPRIDAALGERPWTPWPTYASASMAPQMSRFDALLTASESSASGHRRARRLVRLANGLGLHTVTLQHGVEALGLTMRPEDPAVPVTFASSRILTWTEPSKLPGWLPAETRAKCRAVGRPARTPAPDAKALFPDVEAPRVGVFENLHWGRFDTPYLDWLMTCLEDAATALPETGFLLVPHPAGRFSEALATPLPANVTLLDKAAHRRYTAGDLLPHLDRAITTPSTVALDAARAGRPVAVAAEALDLPAYRPLPTLRDAADWRRFAAGEQDASAREAGSRFVDRVTLPGGAMGRVLDAIARDCAAGITALPAAPRRAMPASPTALAAPKQCAVPPPTPADPIRVFVGADRTQQLACDVLEHSIRARSQWPVRVVPMCELPITPPARPDRRARTGFSFARFAVPRLAGNRGRAIYLDADTMVFADIATLWFEPLEGRRLLTCRAEAGFAPGSAPLHREDAPRYRTAVMLLDCGALDWDVQAIVDGLGERRYDYEALMSGLCVLDRDDIGDRLWPGWNREDSWVADSTALLHYTDMARQPWVSPDHPFGYLWVDELRRMLKAGVIDEARLREEITLGHARPSLLAELERSPNGGPALSAELAAYRRIDEVAGFVPHRRLREQLAEPRAGRLRRRLFAG